MKQLADLMMFAAGAVAILGAVLRYGSPSRMARAFWRLGAWLQRETERHCHPHDFLLEQDSLDPKQARAERDAWERKLESEELARLLASVNLERW